jgi:hypothetical protein
MFSTNECSIHIIECKFAAFEIGIRRILDLESRWCLECNTFQALVQETKFYSLFSVLIPHGFLLPLCWFRNWRRCSLLI